MRGWITTLLAVVFGMTITAVLYETRAMVVDTREALTVARAQLRASRDGTLRRQEPSPAAHAELKSTRNPEPVAHRAAPAPRPTPVPKEVSKNKPKLYRCATSLPNLKVMQSESVSVHICALKL